MSVRPSKELEELLGGPPRFSAAPRCIGCNRLSQHTIPAQYAGPSGKRIWIELCPMCFESATCGDRWLRELIELRLLLRAES